MNEVNYASKPCMSYLDWNKAAALPEMYRVVAVDQAKFNLSWLVFPQIDTHGIESLPREYVDSLRTHMDRETQAALKKPPLVFMRHWWALEKSQNGFIPVTTYMPKDYKVTMLLRANIAQARLVVVEGNVITPEFWKKAA